ncbi:MAG TPA: glycosyltransferase family 4 protein [Actinomycetota bacterium]|nr:glycosyltransferase family 4 protein [Actinomycetota bacterium]
MKVTYVVQRYGPQIVGGAEAACRQFATRLAARGHEVTVLTSCATDAVTWANALPPGESMDEGVRVVRYATTRPRDPGFERLSHRLFSQAQPDPDLEDRWIEAQGPLVPDLIAAMARMDPDLWVFYTYLYYPTLVGLPKVARRAVLHPALHDEPPARLARVREVLRCAAGIYLHSPEEWELVVARAGWPPAQLGLVGLGVEEGSGDVAAFRARAGIGDAPYLLYLGRVEDGKGTGDLGRMFSAYARSHPGPLKLVVAGPVVQAPPPDEAIVVTGTLTDNERWGAMEGARAFVHPSPLESFAIVLFEAWTKALPVLVNGACPVTAGHAARARGGLAYRDFAEFSAALELLLGDPGVARGLGANGKAYAASFAWDAVMDRYTAFLERVRASGS